MTVLLDVASMVQMVAAAVAAILTVGLVLLSVAGPGGPTRWGPPEEARGQLRGTLFLTVPLALALRGAALVPIVMILELTLRWLEERGRRGVWSPAPSEGALALTAVRLAFALGAAGVFAALPAAIADPIGLGAGGDAAWLLCGVLPAAALAWVLVRVSSGQPVEVPRLGVLVAMRLGVMEEDPPPRRVTKAERPAGEVPKQARRAVEGPTATGPVVADEAFAAPAGDQAAVEPVVAGEGSSHDDGGAVGPGALSDGSGERRATVEGASAPQRTSDEIPAAPSADERTQEVPVPLDLPVAAGEPIEGGLPSAGVEEETTDSGRSGGSAEVALADEDLRAVARQAARPVGEAEADDGVDEVRAAAQRLAEAAIAAQLAAMQRRRR